MDTSRMAATAGRPLSHWVMLAVLVLLWGSSPATNKIAVAGLAFIDVVAIRLALAAAALWLVVLVQRRPVALSRRHLAFIVASGVFGNALPFLGITWGQTEVSASMTVVLFAGMPLATILLAHFLVEGERLTAGRTIGFLVGFAGIVVLVGPAVLAELGGAATNLLHELAILAGPICYSINVIVSRNRPAGDVVVFAAASLTVATLLTAPAAIATGVPGVAALASPSGIAVVALALLGTALPTVIMLRLIAAAGAGFSSMINYLIPVWGFLVGVIVLAEPIEARAILALVVILCGILIAERWR